MAMLRAGANANANAQRKGGPRLRSHNDDHFKGTITGASIPEGRKGSDDIEIFDELLEANYELGKPAHNTRNTGARTTNGVSKAGPRQSTTANDDYLERPQPRSKPNSSVSRALPVEDIEYTSVPSARAGSTRFPFGQANPASSSARASEFAYNRPAATFANLSQQNNEIPDGQNDMEQYINYSMSENSRSPAPAQHSDPPQVSRRVIHSPVTHRSSMKPPPPSTAPVDEEDLGNDPLSSPVNASRQAKSKQKVARDSDPKSPNTPRKPNGKKHANLTDDEGVEEITVPPRKSRGGRTSNESVAAAAASKGRQAEEEPEAEDNVVIEPQYDDPPFGDDAGEFAPDYGEDDAGAQDVPPVTGSEESAEDSEPVVKQPVKKKAAAKPPSNQEKKRRRDADDDPPRKKSKTVKPPSSVRTKTPEVDESYLEELVSPDEEDDDDDEGVRRSKRAKIAPVKYWLGEKLEYDTWRPGTQRQVPTILGVRRVPEPPAAPLSRRKKKTKGRSKSRRLESEEPVGRARSVVRTETGWDEKTMPQAFVVDYDTKEEVEKLIAYTAAMVKPRLTERGHFYYERIFSDEKFVAAGQIIIPPKGEKPRKSSKDNTYVFFLIEGVVQVMIHDAKFYLSAGGMFMVPRGNIYYVRNMLDYEAKLFFVQGRLMSNDDVEFYTRGGTVVSDDGRSPGRSRYMYSDDVGMSAQKPSKSRVLPPSPKRRNEYSSPVTAKYASNANGRKR